MGKTILIERDNGENITADLHQPDSGDRKGDAPLVIMACGFPKHQIKGPSLYNLMTDIIKNLGFTSLKFNYTGSAGLQGSDTKFTLENAAHDLEAIFEWAEKNGYKKIAFIAEGLGASIIHMNLPENTVFSILCWPAFDLPYIRDTQFEAAKHQAELDKNGFYTSNDVLIGADLLEELQNTDLIPYLQEAHIPTLILHGAKDDIIPPTHLAVARKSLMAPRLVITSFDDGEHGLPHETHIKTSIHHITEFVEKYWNFAPDE